jgi:hypothetical protein
MLEQVMQQSGRIFRAGSAQVICCPPDFKRRLFWLQLTTLSVIFFFSLLLTFFITFLFPSTLTPLHERLARYSTTSNNEYQVILSFPPSCPSLAYHG